MYMIYYQSWYFLHLAKSSVCVVYILSWSVIMISFHPNNPNAALSLSLSSGSGEVSPVSRPGIRRAAAL